ncbi:hypothetical protein AGDE_14056 [Angomonas deanei]|uniref:Chagasin family peptidase inhibitor I42, putative n=1 Tax=Angomonas deanei TaxID=59799 RepID=A0A7G2CK52_9TRYP|nr:hypothetical protein AGDE_14056 [Angomonas deanei]CAD2219769.1 Chagasin family peptidase inhibitor I42, putative [Angomonas deanei]|eukprot:EPY21479.1 hypothetical protein AGDE_14056 [Angomonas deanei]
MANLQTFTDKDNGKPFFIQSLTEPILVKLTGNQTTGYAWQVAKSLVVEKTGEDTVTGEHFVIDRTYEAKSGVGAGGVFVFKCTPIKALSPGEYYYLKFVYRRPWESENDAENIMYTLKLRA